MTNIYLFMRCARAKRRNASGKNDMQIDAERGGRVQEGVIKRARVHNLDKFIGAHFSFIY